MRFSRLFPRTAVVPLLGSCLTYALNFTIQGGQVLTPGLAIWDAPQPGTPEGGDFLQVALDVSADGRLPLDTYNSTDSPSQIYNITLFLYSYQTGKNFTITNGTASANNVSLGDIMLQEPGSTVKHVNWYWPDCLAGDGQPKDLGSTRGVYNISMHQSFRLNGTNYYTIFDLPISVTNKIDNDTDAGAPRADCNDLLNPVMTPDQLSQSADNMGVLFAPGDAQVIQVPGDGQGSGQGLGSAGSRISLSRNGDGPHFVVCLVAAVLASVL